MTDALLLLAIYALMWRILLTHLAARPDPADVPKPWPRGVQEGEPVRYAVDALTPPSPPEIVEAVGASVVHAAVRVAAR
jgi:hypothetical protein